MGLPGAGTTFLWGMALAGVDIGAGLVLHALRGERLAGVGAGAGAGLDSIGMAK